MGEDFGFRDDESAWAAQEARPLFTADGRVWVVGLDVALRAVGASRLGYAAGSTRYATSNQEDHR